MNQNKWTAVDDYFTDLLVQPESIFEQVLENSTKAELPKIQVSACQGKMLQLLVRVAGARRILEIGTLGGYSTIWMGFGLPRGGSIVTIEADEKHAEVARQNIRLAGLEDIIELRAGAALDVLPTIGAEGGSPFDLIFIDADKPNHPDYLEWAIKLSRPGTVIVGDNVVRNGEVVNATNEDPNVQGVRRFCELLGTKPELSATAIQTVGNKGYDGFSLAIVNHRTE